jgi:hypothetical protein
MQWFLILVVLIAGTVSQTVKPTQSPIADTRNCEETRTLLEDITLVLDQYEPAFRRNAWALTITDDSKNYHLFFEWRPVNGAASVASVDLAMWPCGVTEADLDGYYSDKTLDVLVSSWEEHELTGRCIVDGVRIADFELSREDGDYIARFWIQQVGETRVLEGHLTLPVADVALMSDYAELLYPNTPACE